MKLYDKCRKWMIGDYIAENPDIPHHARAELLFNSSLLSYLVCIPLLVYMICFDMHEKTIPTVVGLACVTIQLLIFKVFRDIWYSSFFLCTVISLLICCNINFNDDEAHLVEPFWMVAVVVFALFMMGVKWGIFYCLVLMTGFTFFVVNKLEDNLRFVLQTIASTKYFLICEIVAAVFTLVYILSMFMRTSRRAYFALRDMNENLGSQNQLVKKQNSDITVLLKEIHHRVKNNLQVVNSLLSLQSSQIRDKDSRKVFADAQYRIKAIALIHERMYKSVELSDIDANVYFRELTNDLLQQSMTNQEIAMHIDIDLPEWNPDNVVPIGLLLNELIANSVEHGGLENNGNICIALRADNGDMTLDYSDNGTGFPEYPATGFGLELIETLNEQMNGDMSVETATGQGVKYRFRFRESV